jgi:hypothetical protein
MKKLSAVVLLLIIGSFHYTLCAQSNHSLKSYRQPRAYYVSTHGKDYNLGTRSNPFKTISKVNKLKLVAGDTLCFKGEENFIGTLNLNVTKNTNTPIIVTSYGVGSAIINGKKKEAIILQGNNFILRNMNAKGWGRKGGNLTNGISISGEDILIENVRVEGFQKSGLQLFDCKRAVVKNVRAWYNGFCGIYVVGSTREASKSIIINDCSAYNNPGDPTNQTNHSGNGILVGFSDSVVIDHCTATNNGWDMPRIGNGPVGIWAYESNRVIIQYCISYRNRTSKGGKDGGGFDFDGGMTNSIMQYCLSYENQGAGYGLFQYEGASPWHNDTVRYCISINDASATEGSGAFFIWNGSADSNQLRDCWVYNNVVYTTVSPTVQFEPQSRNSNFHFYNNIFIGTRTIVDGPTSGERFIGNIWWPSKGNIHFRSYASLTDWADSSRQEKSNGQIVGKQINPLLKGPFTTNLTDPYKLHTLKGFTVQLHSPIKNQGLDLHALFQIPYAPHDFYGTKVPHGNTVEPGVQELKE